MIYPDAIEKLEGEGFCVKVFSNAPHLEGAIASHVDLSLFLLKDTLFISPSLLETESAFFEALAKEKDLKIVAVSAPPVSPYPHDVSLCLRAIGDSVMGNKAHTVKEVLEYCDINGISFIHTNQGYTACTAISFGNAVISADSSILKVADKSGVDTLVISQGNVLLPPYPYGFIGGCSGVCGSTVYFNGSLDSHPDAERIRDFTERHSFSCVSLSASPLYDIGGMIFI